MPTFLVGEYFASKGSSDGSQDRLISIHSSTKERYHSCIKAAVSSGVKVALGSDFVGWDPSITAREFRYLVELAGMSPLAAIHAGTSSAADLLGMPAIGRIQRQSHADLVVIAGNPLEDISLLELGILLVMKDGIIIRRENK